jgi:hypothetical protein
MSSEIVSGTIVGESHHRLMGALGETLGSAGRAIVWWASRWAWGVACLGCYLAEQAGELVHGVLAAPGVALVRAGETLPGAPLGMGCCRHGPRWLGQPPAVSR